MSNSMIHRAVVGLLIIVALAVTIWFAVAQAGPTPTPTAMPTATPAGAMAAGGGPKSPPVNSSEFAEAGMRCGTPEPSVPATSPLTTNDCEALFTNPLAIYDPGDTYLIRVVVHIIDHSDGRGQISDTQVHNQIDVINEDFLALGGTPGGGGENVGIQFALATVNPHGQPTNGITRPCNGTTGIEREKCDAWFDDTVPPEVHLYPAESCLYCDEPTWAPSRYLNVYTTKAANAFGFAQSYPTTPGLVGANDDRVVIRWDVFGRPGEAGSEWQGRLLTHELGHYFGLYHVFDLDGTCWLNNPPNCYTEYDTICDTPYQESPSSDCPDDPMSCGSADSPKNYMDYSEDTCMETFTVEQRRRARCVLENWRVELPEPGLLLQLASGLLGLIVLDKRRRRVNG